VHLLDARIEHLLLHQVAGERAGDAETEQGNAHQNAEFGGNRQIVEFQGRHSRISRREHDSRPIARAQ
jgi:hypothetical protein